MSMITRKTLQLACRGRGALKYLVIASLACGFFLFSLYATAQPDSALAKCAKPEKTLQVAAVYHTPVEEPWVSRVHKALLKAEKNLNIEYTWAEHVSTANFPRVLRGFAEQGYDLIVGDAFGNEKVVRRIAADYPQTPFVFGSGGGPQKPNFSVFDDWIHQPAYLAGMIAGMMTESDKIGAVAAMPIPEVNRLVNAFFAGAQDVNPDVQTTVTFIGSFFDPATAKEAALAQISHGVDVIYAERLGVIQAAAKKDIMAISNMADQHKIAPETVITGPVWHMYPTIKHVIKQIRCGIYHSQNLRYWSYMQRGGATLAPYHQWASKLPESVKKAVAKRKQAIISGNFIVPVDESSPAE